MQNAAHTQPPQPAGLTLSEHLATLPALRHAAGQFEPVREWLQTMSSMAGAGDARMAQWYASRVSGFLVAEALLNARHEQDNGLLEVIELQRRLIGGRSA